MKMATNYKNILKFLFEVGATERVRRTGPWVYGIKDPENVAEHSYRVAIITLVLARLEEADVSKLVMYSLIHDLHETRLLDRNAVSQKYLPTPNKTVDRIREDQFAPLGESIFSLYKEISNLTEEEFKIVKDADYIEDGLRAKELKDRGMNTLEHWLDEITPILTTKSAKKIWKEIKSTSFIQWVLDNKDSSKELKKHYSTKK